MYRGRNWFFVAKPLLIKHSVATSGCRNAWVYGFFLSNFVSEFGTDVLLKDKNCLVLMFKPQNLMCWQTMKVYFSHTLTIVAQCIQGLSLQPVLRHLWVGASSRNIVLFLFFFKQYNKWSNATVLQVCLQVLPLTKE